MKREKSILRNRFFWLAVLGIAIIGGLFYLFFLSTIFKIKEIQIFGNQEIPTESLRESANGALSSEGINIFMVNQEEIEQELLGNFPKILDISFKRKFPSTFQIEIKEREAVAEFCHMEDCFLLSGDGVIFERLPLGIENNESIEIRNQLFKETAEIGKKTVSSDELNKILKIRSELKNNLQILAAEAVIISWERIDIKTSEGWQIYFSCQKDIDWQLTELKSVLENEIFIEDRKNLEYIDLRFNKVFYK